ncbi:DUF2490 domain-containing protein [Flagellimonas sp.]|uniref:DUF2490 domain-containing protein n=1 Tax=Flagellimonas sp. TaxID=2058762 RepID=UPI003B5CD636
MGYTKLPLSLISVLTFFICTVDYAQLPHDGSSGSWLEVYGNNKIGDNWSIPIAGILRHNEMLEKYDFSFIRTGISYQLSKSSIFTGGVAFLVSKNYSEIHETTKTYQYWVYEQFALKSKFKRNIISHRWRLENRWIKSDQKKHWNNRFRYRLQFVRPIYNDTYVKSFNEIFLSLDHSFFNQNRFYIGFGQILSPAIHIEIGYLKNHFKYSDRNFIRMAVTFRTKFSPKEIAQNTN